MKNAPHLKLVAIIQARMNSARFPRKVMHEILGRTILGHVLDRIRRCTAIDGICIATSIEASDAAIEAFAVSEGVRSHRGSLDNVAERLRDTAIAMQANALIRINADSPLIDPLIVDHAASLFRRERPDLVTNVLCRTYPKGQSVEVIDVSALVRACNLMSTTEEREHVTPWFYSNRLYLRIVDFCLPSPRGGMQLSVDTLDDAARVEAILKRLGGSASAHGLNALIAAADAIDAGKH